MSKISILNLIETIGSSVVLKISNNFPEYDPGDDVDLLVLDRQSTVDAICRFFEKHFENEGELLVTDTPGHCHTDFLFDGKLEIRIDLIDAFDFYSKFSVKNGFVAKIFKDRQVRHHGNQAYYTPTEEDNLTIRYFEYLEYFDKWPNKVKHLEYICAIGDEAVKQRFFENTHRFIRFERKVWAPTTVNPFTPASRREALRDIRKNIKFLVFSSLRIWFRKFYNLFRKKERF